MDKIILRKRIIDELKRMPSHWFPKLYRQLFLLPQWQTARVIAVTLNTRIELETEPIIRQANRQHKRVVVPKILPKRRMEFDYLNASSHLIFNQFGIREVANPNSVNRDQIDLFVVPGLGFALETHDRLGFGGGYYDRYLRTARGFKVALAMPPQLFNRPAWPVESTDVKLDLILR